MKTDKFMVGYWNGTHISNMSDLHIANAIRMCVKIRPDKVPELARVLANRFDNLRDEEIPYDTNYI